MKIAAVQMDVALGEPGRNLERMRSFLSAAAAEGAQLVAFPECAVTGYCFEDLNEARPFSESIPGPATDAIAATCRELGVCAVFGMLECDEARLFNACALVGPEGLIGSYRKIHLPFLGVDRFATPGNRPFAVHDAAGACIGMNICYDSAFPESSRIMALDGADLIVLPTNFPTGAECMAEYIVNARAMENNVYYACVNRVGVERGFRFIGNSRICDPSGRVLAGAPHTDEAILFADIDLERARNKHVVRVPGKHEIHRFDDRRPEMYGRIAKM